MPNQARAPLTRARSDDHDSSQRRRARLSSTRLATKHSPFHSLLTARQRRTFSDTSSNFSDMPKLKSNTAKSVKVFRGEARGILHGIFFVLLLRFLLVLVVAVGTFGIAAVLILMIKEPGVSLTSYLIFYS
ncbi:unnamed protein product [Peronospora belbahrii]|uniref:Uncharacterized protein n=1 Tax=Peronospora belbahrii TaxID=622444 RepID=A0ABN8CSR6_9STRA|nr:unnamed protein product [Peronospora belbahrii]